uniref:Uncharacterized protein n=2 Tax=Plectus sambesii TaxID=2011161 RepID=A0A914XPR4_9BILA
MMDELARLQAQLRDYQNQHAQAISNEQLARQRLEAQLANSHDNLNRVNSQLSVTDGASRSLSDQISRDLDDIRRQISSLEAKIINMEQEIASLKNTVNSHTHDLMQLNNEIKSRPVVDPNKVASTTQQLDGRLRDLHGQLMQVKQNVDGEANERRRVNQAQAENIARLQDYIQRQDASKNDILQNLARKGDMDSAKLSEEAKRLNDKIQLITNEVTRNMTEREQRMRDENQQKYQTLEKAIKAELDARLQYEKDVRQFLDERYRAYNEELEALKALQQTDKAKYKERFQKLNEALAVLERHLEQGNKKMDRIVAAEIQSRKLHEKGLLAKMGDVEDRLAGYLGGLNRAIDEAKAGNENVKMPLLDTDALHREMEAIAADKHKLSMEGLLKLEEKMSRVHQGLQRDKRELQDRIEEGSGDTDSVAKIKHQLRKLDDVQEDLEKAHERIRDKVERQIPQDLNELSAKCENIKHQLNTRIDKEEEERYLAIKELQDAISKMRNRPGRDIGGGAGGVVSGPANEQLARDVDECKVAIKKLAESVTTVKNVLDRKLNEEIRTREKDSEKLNAAVDSMKKK